jgi:heptosyltransferase-2
MVHSLADSPLSIGLTRACVRRADLLVTTDSGPRHFAAAFDRPVVTLFGPTHIAWTETDHPKAVHLQKQLPCGPCQQRVCPLQHHRCMTELTPAEVFAAAEDLLARELRVPLPEVRHAG